MLAFTTSRDDGDRPDMRPRRRHVGLSGALATRRRRDRHQTPGCADHTTSGGRGSLAVGCRSTRHRTSSVRLKLTSAADETEQRGGSSPGESETPRFRPFRQRALAGGEQAPAAPLPEMGYPFSLRCGACAPPDQTLRGLATTVHGWPGICAATRLWDDHVSRLHPRGSGRSAAETAPPDSNG